MTAVVSRERAKATCLTGAAGVLMLAVAFVMMVVAAPGHVHGPAKPSVAQLTADVGPQLTPRSHLEGAAPAVLRLDLLLRDPLA